MAKRKGISRCRVCVVLFILILAGTSLLNSILSVLQTTSRTSSAEKEPVEYDMLFHRKSALKSVLPPVHWKKEKTVLSKAGKLLGKCYLSLIPLGLHSDVTL